MMSNFLSASSRRKFISATVSCLCALNAGAGSATSEPVASKPQLPDDSLSITFSKDGWPHSQYDPSEKLDYHLSGHIKQPDFSSAYEQSAESAPQSPADDRESRGVETDHVDSQNPYISDPEDPSNLLRSIREPSAERGALIPDYPLREVHEAFSSLSNSLYNSSGIRFGLNINHVSQSLSLDRADLDSRLDQVFYDKLIGSQPFSGSTTDLDFILSWDLLNRGQPSVGKIYAHLEGRWDYGTQGPQNLGFVTLKSAQGTANAFSAYEPTFILRNLYWQQGGRDAGWFYRIGRITPDAILGTSKYLSPVTTFLSNAGTGLFSSGYPDSGYGAVGAVSITNRLAVLGLVSDAYANRFTDGDIGKLTFYTAGEILFKQWPLTENAGFSKITFWHQPGGLPINAATGKKGWGMTVKLEQELSTDGRLVGIFRWGRSFDGASIWDQQVGVHLVLNNPRLFRILGDDAFGVGFNWVKVNDETRDEYGLETFYRFPLFDNVDMTLAYQYVFDPANAVTPVLRRSLLSGGSAFSLRLRSTF